MSIPGCRLVPPSCHICGGPASIACSSCTLIDYCSQLHLEQHRHIHHEVCVEVVNAHKSHLMKQRELARLNQELEGLSSSEQEMLWRRWQSADYGGTKCYNAHADLINVIITKFGATNASTLPSQVCLDNMREMMIYGKVWAFADLKDKILPVYIRLGRDSEAYNMIHWMANTPTPLPDWRNMDPPFFTMQDADIMDSERPLLEGNDKLNLSNIAAATLIKIRALIDLRILKSNTGCPPDQLVGTLVATRQRQFMHNADIEEAIVELEEQVYNLFQHIDAAHLKFWGLLLDNPAQVERNSAPDRWKDELIETNMAIMDNYAAWEETPGAIEEIRIIKNGDTSEI